MFDRTVIHISHVSGISRILWAILFFVVAALLLAVPQATYSQSNTPTPVLAEALNQANLRSGPGVTYDQMGQIVAGTKYPVIGRSGRFPWYLISLPDKQAWVFADLVKVSGPVGGVPYTDVILTPGAPPVTATLPQPTTVVGAAGNGGNNVLATQPNQPPKAAALAEAISNTNVRYGPGVDYRRVGTIIKGQKYEIVRRHVQFPWVEITYPPSPSGRGWVSKETITVTGDLASVPATGITNFGYPTLTPTALMVVTAQPPWTSTPPANLNADRLPRLGNTLYDMMLQSRFDPSSERLGSVFVIDVATRQTVSLNPNVAYSGVSLMKIPVMLAFYRKTETGSPGNEMSNALAEMMVCSENRFSNVVLRYLGDGDQLAGTRYVTETMQLLGLKSTFISRPFFIGNVPGTPTPSPVPEAALRTTSDQISAQPDLYNQTTPAELAWLLGGIYQCAVDGSGPLTAALSGSVTMMECRQIINAMRYNKIGALSEAGVPQNVFIAHKHGWGDDTHGDAALVLSPGGAFVFVAILHNPQWLRYEESFPLISEMTRATYNTFNPTAPLDKIYPQPVPAQCTPGKQLILDLQTAELPPLR